jgi:anti-sigma regulatory factor (Ser/Thr protein kinase)
MQYYSGVRDVRAVGDARHFVKGAVLAEGCGELASSAVLLSSEVVTNAVIHGDTGFDVRVSATGDGVRIEVDDDGGGEPVDLQADTTADRGRGLMIVASMSRRWGVEHRGDGMGKTVWFEL